PYAIYLFVGLVPWTFTANAISAATSSLIANSTLITKVNFLREIIPFSAIAAKLVDFLLISIILVIFLVIYHIPPHLSLLFIPLIFIVQLGLVTGISLILSSINVFFRDVENILNVFLTVWMYLTPVLYPPEFIPSNVRFLFGLNPMTGIINSYRNVILYGVLPPWNSFAFSIVITLTTVLFGLWLFKRNEK